MNDEENSVTLTTTASTQFNEKSVAHISSAG